MPGVSAAPKTPQPSSHTHLAPASLGKPNASQSSHWKLLVFKAALSPDKCSLLKEGENQINTAALFFGDCGIVASKMEVKSNTMSKVTQMPGLCRTSRPSPWGPWPDGRTIWSDWGQVKGTGNGILQHWNQNCNEAWGGNQFTWAGEEIYGPCISVPPAEGVQNTAGSGGPTEDKLQETSGGPASAGIKPPSG